MCCVISHEGIPDLVVRDLRYVLCDLTQGYSRPYGERYVLCDFT